MDADGQAKIVRRLIDREKTRIVERLVALEAAKEDSHRAMLLPPVQLFDRLFDRAQRGDDHPAEPSVALRARVGQIAVVGTGYCRVEDRIVGKIDEKQRRVDHLYIDAELIHISKPRGNIRQLAAGELNVAAGLLELGRRGRDQPVAAPSDGARDDVAVDQPERVACAVKRILGGLDDYGTPRIHLAVE